MAAKFPIDVTVVDKTRPTMDALARRWDKWTKTTERSVKPVQLISKSLDRILKPYGFERFAKDFGRFGESATGAAAGLGDMVASMGGIGEAAAAAAAPLGIAVGATAAVGTAVALAGFRYNEAGASIAYFSDRLGMSVTNVQKWIGAADQMQVSGDDAKATLMGLRDALARPWEHPQAGQVLRAKGFVPPAPGETFDEDAWLKRVAGIIHQQTNPAVKAQIAEAFGIPNTMIPLLDQDPKTLQAQLDAVKKTNPYSDQEARNAAARDQRDRRISQSIGGLRRAAGHFASDLSEPFVSPAMTVLQNAARDVEKFRSRHGWAAEGTALNEWFTSPALAAGLLFGRAAGKTAVDHLKRQAARLPPARTLPGARLDIRPQMARLNAMRRGDAAFNRFADRIERQESGAHQFRRPGQPLISKVGAVGAMQMLPDTARQTALAHGIGFDAGRLASDKSYNELLGRLHLQDLLTRYGGSQTLAAAAYNAGERVVDDWLSGLNLSGKNPRGRVLPDPRQGSEQEAAFRSLIPFAETRGYVATTAQPIEITVKFVGAPPGTMAQAKGPPGAKINLNIGHGMAGAG